MKHLANTGPDRDTGQYLDSPANPHSSNICPTLFRGEVSTAGERVGKGDRVASPHISAPWPTQNTKPVRLAPGGLAPRSMDWFPVSLPPTEFRQKHCSLGYSISRGSSLLLINWQPPSQRSKMKKKKKLCPRHTRLFQFLKVQIPVPNDSNAPYT